MKITQVRVDRLAEPKGKVLAFADILIDDVLEINHIRIVDGRNGPFAAMPSWRNPDGTWADFVVPQNSELRSHILDTVMAAFDEAKAPEPKGDSDDVPF